MHITFLHRKVLLGESTNFLTDAEQLYIGMMVCFFSGSSKFLLRSWRMD